jgi:hypothetical protein
MIRRSEGLHMMLTKNEKIASYADLQKMIHEALRIQHPEWIGSNGESEMCELYETRFAQLLGRENAVQKNQWQHKVV